MGNPFIRPSRRIKIMRLARFVLLVISAFPLLSLSAQQETIDFSRQIRPLLSDRCGLCHGNDAAANQSGIRLDIESDAVGAGAIVPGKPDESHLIERIMSADPELRMPPPDSNLKLNEQEILLLKQWIGQGAKYDSHWAFKPLPQQIDVSLDAVPRSEIGADHFDDSRLSSSVWAINEIDSFVWSRLTAEGLRPAPEAERWQWLRRVTFDLTGQPPTMEQIDQFASDRSTSAFENVVDRLLTSKHFGEHLATNWLDAVRYADSYGYQSDQLSPTWPYRDWVVRAINDNLRYDQFLTWQIAGDLLPNATREQRLATAFNRLHRQTNEGGSVELEWRTEYVADRVHTLGTAVMGMTLECARCHDHKFDPVSQQDYYNLFAFFNNIDEWGVYNDSSRIPTPTLLLPDDGQQSQIHELEKQLGEVNGRLLIERERLSAAPFADWRSANATVNDLPDPVAHWTLDRIGPDFTLPNESSGQQAGSTSPANKSIPGQIGQAFQFTGDDVADFPTPGGLEPWQPYAISFWLKAPNGLKDAVILHRQSGTDSGHFGTQVSLRDGHLFLAKIRFWPGNALAIETVGAIETDKWIHVVVGNDASGDAEGLSIIVDGNRETRVMRNCLTKDPAPGGSGFSVGQRFRSPGFKDGAIDDIRFYDRPLSVIQASLIGKNPGNQSGGGTTEQIKCDEFDESDVLKHFLLTNVDYAALQRERSLLVQQLLTARTPVIETMVMDEMSDIQPAYVLNRGEYDAPKTEQNLARRTTPNALPPMPADLSRDRLGLARWLTSNDHPLTARVAVNRHWQSFFGNGLVTTPEDFGMQGSPPSHPQLLDWLARGFVDNGWDVKWLCKQIVLSATYRQSSRCDPALRQRDPDNVLLARGPAGRLTAESIRDLALVASGLLDETSGGPPVSPYQPENLWTESNSMSPAYQQSTGQSLYRRSLYSVWKRTAPLPNMLNFDAAGREVCAVRRGRTNTPLQALVLLNDVQFVEAARVLAERAVSAEPSDVNRRIQFMFNRLAGRNTDDAELRLLAKLHREQIEIFTQSPDDANRVTLNGDTKAGGEIEPIELAATTVVAQAILNSDAAIWKR